MANLSEHVEGNDARPTTETELSFWRQDVAYVAGLDEAGRGPWAGPVYAGAVILPQDPEPLAALHEVRDSKKLSPRRREQLCSLIEDVAVAAGVGWSSAAEIDDLGIVPATRLAMCRALERLRVEPEALIIDALLLPGVSLSQRAFPRADATCLSVAAASILAKVYRDRWMVQKAEIRFPGYGFAQHKGYGTPQHREALDRLGACAIHRRSFRPIANLIAAPQDNEMLPGFDASPSGGLGRSPEER
ncbi:MAG: ribonuclease HII [Anaerolineae bacterium]